MKNEVLKLFPYLDLVVAGQLIFFAVFVGALFWVFRRGGNSFYDQLARIPLDEQEAGRE